MKTIIVALAALLLLPAAASAKDKRQYYVSLGDSYATGFRDIHARTSGYRIIADLVVGTLPKR